MDTSRTIALAHDSFTQQGGAERIITALHEMYPEATVSTLVVDKKYDEMLSTWSIKTSILQPLYRLWPHFKHFLFLLPVGVGSLRFPENSLIISSSSLFLKALRAPKNSVHVAYCHTPVRFLWSEPGYVDQEVPWIIRPVIRWWLQFLKQYDLYHAKKVDYFIANSKEVQRRIKQFYGRDSSIIYPYVDTEFWKPTRTERQDYFLIAGRLVAHKDNEVVIRAFNTLGLPLHVVGTGNQEKYLRSIAKPNIIFRGRLSDEDLRSEYSGAQAFIFPPFEDFGIMPLEAQACGTPVIGLAKGGTMEVVVDGVTGMLLPDITEQSLVDAIQLWQSGAYNGEAMRKQAEQFSKTTFKEQINSFVTNLSRN